MKTHYMAAAIAVTGLFAGPLAAHSTDARVLDCDVAASHVEPSSVMSSGVQRASSQTEPWLVEWDDQRDETELASWYSAEASGDYTRFEGLGTVIPHDMRRAIERENERALQRQLVEQDPGAEQTQSEAQQVLEGASSEDAR